MDTHDDTPPAGKPQPPASAGEPAAPVPPPPARETAPHPRPVPPPARETAPHPRPVPPAPPPVQIGGNVGGDVAARDLNKELNAGRDIVGRDVVTNTSTTNVGFTADMVQKLLVTVAALVAATAACFFMLGGGAAIVIVAALGRPVNSNNQTAAEEFAATLASVRSLAPGQSAEISFTEDQISSYFHLVIEPTLNGQITDGQVRLLDSGQLLISGHASQLDGARFAATFAPQQNVPRAPLRLTGALVRLVPLGNSPLGWVPVPTGALQPMADSLNSLFGNVEFTNVRPHRDTHAWDVTVMGQ